jgi:peptidoglycan/xylan/chitin deacetylase (PgdA/CDA1 family)
MGKANNAAKKMRSTLMLAAAGSALAVMVTATGVSAACPDPATLGTSRVLTVDTRPGLEVGTFNFAKTLPLNDMEVVLTIDDGPLRGVTERVLAALRAQCAKATFFVVGSMAAAAPDLVRAAAADGHTIGTHTYSHPQPISMISLTKGVDDINLGFATVARALGTQPAPFFRFPGFAMTDPLETRLNAAGIGIFSTDVMGYDWNTITPDRVRMYILDGLAKRRGGIILIHDTHARTAEMLPQLLKDLKARGYKLVHLIPSDNCPETGCRIRSSRARADKSLRTPRQRLAQIEADD